MSGRVYLNARNLLISLESHTGLRLFGGVLPFVDDVRLADIPGGDLKAAFDHRLAAVGVDASGLSPTIWRRAEMAVIGLAMRLSATSGDPTRIRIQRSAIEFLTGMLYTRPSELLPFDRYLAYAIKLDALYSVFDAAFIVSRPESFRHPYLDWQSYLESARKSLHEIRKMLHANPHLGVLRERIAVAPIYSRAAFERLADLPESMRKPVLMALLRQVRHTHNPDISRDAVDLALGQVEGNRLLASGTASGVRVANSLSALGVCLTGETDLGEIARRDWHFHNVSLHEFGMNIANMCAALPRGRMQARDAHNIVVELNLSEVNAPTDIGMPLVEVARIPEISHDET